MILSIDIETYSDIDLTRSGVYAYAEDKSFEILLFAYAFNDEEVKVIDLARGEKIPNSIIRAIEDEAVIKTAFNANFERVCLSKYLRKDLKANSWRCTMVHAASLGLPLSLEKVAEVLRLDIQKMKEGRDLIKYFSLLQKYDETEGQLMFLNTKRNYPEDDLKRWELFKSYCKRDVEVERAIRKRLEKYLISDSEQQLYVLDQEINDRGILIDMNLVYGAIECDELYRSDINRRLKEITGIENPNSVSQLKSWLIDKGIAVRSLSQKEIMKLLKHCNEEIAEVLNLRLKLSKTSIKKYEAIERSICSDLKVRGLFQFYGANRTGRWAGRLVQVQNLPQNHIDNLNLARKLVMISDLLSITKLYENVPQVLSELIRNAFIAKEGHKFIVSDFSAIEARILAWLAGERWRIEVFNSHGRIYEESASRIFDVPVEMITKDSDLRNKGKIAELALGYGGGEGALKAMGAVENGLDEDELLDVVRSWRAANSKIVSFWWKIGSAAINAVKYGRYEDVGYIKIYCESGVMFIVLPSGRKLAYIRPRIGKNKYGTESIIFEGISSAKKWESLETYGPKLVENIVQAIARDILAEAMIRLSAKGYKIVMHVHDEVVIEVPEEEECLGKISELMTVTPKWAEGLKLNAEGFECKYYKK